MWMFKCLSVKGNNTVEIVMTMVYHFSREKVLHNNEGKIRGKRNYVKLVILIIIFISLDRLLGIRYWVVSHWSCQSR